MLLQRLIYDVCFLRFPFPLLMHTSHKYPPLPQELTPLENVNVIDEEGGEKEASRRHSARSHSAAATPAPFLPLCGGIYK